MLYKNNAGTFNPDLTRLCRVCHLPVARQFFDLALFYPDRGLSLVTFYPVRINS
jgi:hypothetical protein